MNKNKTATHNQEEFSAVLQSPKTKTFNNRVFVIVNLVKQKKKEKEKKKKVCGYGGHSASYSPEAIS